MPKMGLISKNKNFTKEKDLGYCLGQFWLSWRDSNPRDDGVKVRCLTAWRQLIIKNKNRI